MNCTELAASLSSNYRDNTPYDNGGSSSLSRYLGGHGLLLTMCFPFSCMIEPRDSHISASWINDRLGVHVIPTDNQIGLILDPLKADLKCIYPTDAATLSRDGNGCGPMTTDPEYGSQGARSYNFITRYLARKQFREYKDVNFGANTDWLDIPCDILFPIPPAGMDEQALWDLDQHNQTLLEFLKGF